jgi:hypothetical protein
MKLKELELKQINFVKSDKANFTIVNVSYQNEPFVFQCPKCKIEFIENDLLIVEIKNVTFLSLLRSIENFLEQRFKLPVNSLIENNLVKFKLKVSKSLRPEFKIINNGSLFNFHNLSAGMEIICLVSLEKLWITESINYSLTVKEINLNNKNN